MKFAMNSRWLKPRPFLLDVHDAYEDARAGGDTLEEAARKQKLTPVVIDAVDRSARTRDGEVLSDLPESRTLLAQAFDTSVSVESPPINIGAEGFLWFEVLDIIPARDQTLEEVKERVIEDWQAEEADNILGSKAEEMKKRVDAGEELAAVAAEVGMVTQTVYSANRNYEDAVLGPAAIQAAFAGPEGLVAVANAVGDTSKVLMNVNQVNTPDASGASSQPEKRLTDTVEAGQ